MNDSISSERLYADIVTTLSKLFGIHPSIVTMESNLVKDLDLDSIDIVDLLSTASDQYNVDLSPYDFDGVSSLGEFISRLQQQIIKHSKPVIS